MGSRNTEISESLNTVTCYVAHSVFKYRYMVMITTAVSIIFIKLIIIMQITHADINFKILNYINAQN